MHTKNLTLIIALTTAVTLSINPLNAAEPALSPKAKGNQIKPVPVTTADPDLLARNPEVAASPRVLANFPHLARGEKAKPDRPMAACNCCKP